MAMAGPRLAVCFMLRPPVPSPLAPARQASTILRRCRPPTSTPARAPSRRSSPPASWRRPWPRTPARDALFLTHFPVTALPYFVGGAALLALPASQCVRPPAGPAGPGPRRPPAARGERRALPRGVGPSRRRCPAWPRASSTSTARSSPGSPSRRSGRFSTSGSTRTRPRPCSRAWPERRRWAGSSAAWGRSASPPCLSVRALLAVLGAGCPPGLGRLVGGGAGRAAGPAASGRAGRRDRVVASPARPLPARPGPRRPAGGGGRGPGRLRAQGRGGRPLPRRARRSCGSSASSTPAPASSRS